MGMPIMALGGVVLGSGLGEVAINTALAPETFGVSEVLNIIHAPVVVALGGLIALTGVGISVYGVKFMWDSNVPKWAYISLAKKFIK